ncbi:BTB/POZ protein [Rhizophagus clarus]|uniref:BTB/POZ protein n=1 Tax=Rhizophagus clarus TaxID=94130 RepID=A0A8H3QSP0_9GLOM|nr:BTB/POZ protein [Rhizophagus clarus]
MNYDQTQKLSLDLLNLFKDPSECNVKILAGREPNIKEFKAHSLILSSRSIYFKRAFSAQWAKKEDGFFISNQPNISPIVFEILINYIYSGTLSVNNNEVSLVDILIASDELELLEIYQQLKKRLLENESAWKSPKDFTTLCQFRHDDRFANLYEVAIGLVCKNAHSIFNSKEFLKMEEEHIIQLLERDDLKLEEIEIWDYLIKWGIENTDSILDKNSITWTSTDFSELEKTLHNYPNTKPSLKNLPLRVSEYHLDSEIINAQDLATIASWIDKKKGIPYRIKDIPFKFELIYRASREGFNTKKFHECCDNKGPTVVIIKVRNSGEIIVESSEKEAIIWCQNKGPCFGLRDLWILNNLRTGNSKQKSYEYKIIDSETFEIEEFEVFQIIDERSNLVMKVVGFTGIILSAFFAYKFPQIKGAIVSIMMSP